MASQRCSPYLPFASGRSVSGHLEAILSAPRWLQEASKLLSFGSRGLQTPPRRPQEASRADLPAILSPFWSHFGALSKRFCHHVGHFSSLKASSPRALDPRPQAWRNARERLNQCLILRPGCPPTRTCIFLRSWQAPDCKL